MNLPSILTSESAIHFFKMGIQGIALSFGVDGLAVIGVAEGVAAGLKDWKEARQSRAIAAAEAASANIASKVDTLYQRLPVAERMALMQGLAQVDDPEQLVKAAVIEAELAKITNPEQRQLAEGWVRALPDHVRRTLASQADPSGRTATAQNIPQNAAELGAAFAAIPSVYKAGDAVPHMPGWVLEAQIGGGGFGEVWRARKREMLCAVKFCKGGATAANLRIERDLVERVAKLARRTPGLVQIEDDFLDQQPPSLVYEFVQGCTLETHMKARIREDKPFAWGEAAGMILELAQTMAVCHRESIIHRDLKPANILLDLADPAEPRLRITDFGIGAALDQSTGAAFQGYTQSLGSGSARYAPPEQLQGGTQHPHPREDIHALGIIWLQLIVGDLREDQLDGPTRRGLLREGHPEALIELLEDCIATKPAHRPESAVLLQQRLHSLLGASWGEAASRAPAPVPSHSTITLPPPLPAAPLPKQPATKLRTGVRVEEVKGQLTRKKTKHPEDFAAELAGWGLVEVASFAFNENDYQFTEQLLPLPTKIDWHTAIPAAQRPAKGLIARLPGTDREAARDAETLCGAGSTPLLARFTSAGDSFSIHDFSVLLRGQPLPLLDKEKEDTARTLREIAAAMIPIRPGKVQRTQGGELRVDQPYSLCKYPVTQAWYEAVMGSNPSHFTGNAQRPVEKVNWHEAQAFCQRLSELNARYGGSQKQRYCLPSEAQWEYACRAGSPGDYGLLKNGMQGTVDQMARYKANSGDKTWPVGSLEPNAWGLYDMHGNVWEWCEDIYEGSYRVIRGGSWNGDGLLCRSATRSRNDPGNRGNGLGFRVAAVPA